MEKEDYSWKPSISLEYHFNKILQAHDDKNKLAFDALQRAVDKAEIATEKRFESVNEFRTQLGDQARSFMPRTEYEVTHKNLDTKIDVISKLVDRIENRKEGGNNMYLLITSIVALLVGIISIVMHFVK